MIKPPRELVYVAKGPTTEVHMYCVQTYANRT